MSIMGSLAPPLLSRKKAQRETATIGVTDAFRPVDAYMVGLLTVVLIPIGKLGFLPVAVQTIASLMVPIFFSGIFLRGLNVCIRVPAFLLLILLMLVSALMSEGANLFVMRYGVVGSVGRVVSRGCASAFFVGYMFSRPRGWRFFLATTLIVLGICQAWYFLELTLQQPFTGARAWLFRDIYLLDAFKANLDPIAFGVRLRTGLVPYLHLLGYVSCGAGVLAAGQLLLRPASQGTSRTLWPAVQLLISALVIMLSQQRSAALGLVVGAVFIAGSGRQRKSAFQAIAVLFVVVAIGWGLLSFLQSATMQRAPETGHLSFQDKLQNANDYGLRLRMQLEAIKLILQCPLGLAASGVDWNEAGLAVAAQDANVSLTKELSVHNGYLSYGLQFGWPGIVLVITFLWQTARIVLAMRRLSRFVYDDQAFWSIVIGGAIVGLFFVQAMFHNSSIFKREPTSLVLFCVMIYLYETAKGQVTVMHRDYMLGQQGLRGA